jgi:hypothetical protein
MSKGDGKEREKIQKPKPHAGFGLPVGRIKIGCGSTRLLEVYARK